MVEPTQDYLLLIQDYTQPKEGPNHSPFRILPTCEAVDMAATMIVVANRNKSSMVPGLALGVVRGGVSLASHVTT